MRRAPSRCGATTASRPWIDGYTLLSEKTYNPVAEARYQSRARGSYILCKYYERRMRYLTASTTGWQ